MIRLLLSTLFGAAVITGCATGPCADGASANQSVANKFASCVAQDSTFFAGGFSPCFDESACESNLASCTAADRAVEEAVAACENGYAAKGDCSAAAWTAEIDCAAAASMNADGGSALSPGCFTAFRHNPGSCGADAG